MKDWNMALKYVFLNLASFFSYLTFWLLIVLVTSSVWWLNTSTPCFWVVRKKSAFLEAALSLLMFYFPRIYFMYHIVHFPVQWLVTPLNMSGDGNMALLPSITSGPSHNTERNELFLLQAVEQISSNSLSCLICSLMLKQKMGPGSVFHLHIYSGNR